MKSTLPSRPSQLPGDAQPRVGASALRGWRLIGLLGGVLVVGVLLLGAALAAKTAPADDLPTLIPLLSSPTPPPVVEQKTPPQAPVPEATPTLLMTLGLASPAAPIEFATEAPLAAPTASRLSSMYLPMVLQSYRPPPPPPRLAEAFRLLPPSPLDVWPDPILEGQTASKLSVHSLGTGDPYVMEFVRRTKPRVIKAVGDIGWLVEVKSVSPQTITIGRIYDQDESWVLRLDPVEAARQFIAERQEHYRLNPFVDFWEGWNEIDPPTPDHWRWYAQFEAERACQMYALGYRAAVGTFAFGTPEYDEMAYFIPALQAAHRCGAIFTLHEGVPPTLACPTTSLGEANAIPGASVFDVPVGHHALRYRFWYEGYLKPLGLGDLPLVISEVAVAADCNIPGGDAWRSYQDWWVANGVGPSAEQAYVNLLAWYDRELRHDPYVVGATIFTAGSIDQNSHWYRWDLHPIMIPLAHYMVTQR